MFFDEQELDLEKELDLVELTCKEHRSCLNCAHVRDACGTFMCVILCPWGSLGKKCSNDDISLDIAWNNVRFSVAGWDVGCVGWKKID